MENDLLTEACLYLSMEQVNIELLFDDDRKGDIYYGVRLRPWANSPRKSQMILGVGSTLAEAFESACVQHVADAWEEMDWRARPARAIARKELEQRMPNVFGKKMSVKPSESDDNSPTPIIRRNR